MTCRMCKWPFPPHELVRHEGEGKEANGLCLKCVAALLADRELEVMRLKRHLSPTLDEND